MLEDSNFFFAVNITGDYWLQNTKVKSGGFLALGMYSKSMTDLKNNLTTSWNATLGQNLDRSFAGAVYKSSFP